MKQLFLLLCIATAASCNNSTENQAPASMAEGAVEGSVHAGAGDTIVTSAQPLVLDGCYEMTLKKDSAFMQLQVADTLVSGTLRFHFYEKDKNEGTLKGVLRGDRIIAAYSFQSEGVTSVREVVFKIKDNTLVQGFGHLKEEGGKLVFQNRDALQYQTANPFIKTTCR